MSTAVSNQSLLLDKLLPNKSNKSNRWSQTSQTSQNDAHATNQRRLLLRRNHRGTRRRAAPRPTAHATKRHAHPTTTTAAGVTPAGARVVIKLLPGLQVAAAERVLCAGAADDV